MANQKISQLTAATTLADTDNAVLATAAGSRRMTAQTLRAKLAGLQGVWDVSTGVTSPAIPVASSGLNYSVVSGADYSATLPPAGGEFRVAWADDVPAKPSGEAWARITLSAYTPGDTTNGAGFFITNAGATLPDLLQSLDDIPNLYGTVQWFIFYAVDNDAGLGFGYLIYANAIAGAFSAATGLTAGTNVYFGIDYTAGAFVRDIGGVLQTIAAPFTIGATKLWLGIGTGAAPATMANPVLFTFAASDGGRSPFEVVGDAAPPAGAAEAKRYLVQNAGQYAGATLADGDVAEFTAGLASVIVTRSAQTDIEQAIADYLALNPPVSLYMKALQARRFQGVANDPTEISGPFVEGDAMLVWQTPAGAFATFNPLSVAVFDGAAWQAFNPLVFERVRFEVVANDPYPKGVGILYIGNATNETPAPGSRGDLRGDDAPAWSSGGTLAQLFAEGWVFDWPRLGALTVNQSTFPWPVIPGTVYIGGHELLRYSLTGATEYAVQIQSRTQWESATYQELNAQDVVLEVWNDTGAQRHLSFADGVYIGRFRFEPGETRRFRVIRMGGGSGGVTVAPINSRVPYRVIPASGWYHPSSPLPPFDAIRDGDVVTLTGRLSCVSPNTFLANSLPPEFRPAVETVVPVSFYDGAVWIPGVAIVTNGGDIIAQNVAPVAGWSVAFSCNYSREVPLP